MQRDFAGVERFGRRRLAVQPKLAIAGLPGLQHDHVSLFARQRRRRSMHRGIELAPGDRDGRLADGLRYQHRRVVEMQVRAERVAVATEVSHLGLVPDAFRATSEAGISAPIQAGSRSSQACGRRVGILANVLRAGRDAAGRAVRKHRAGPSYSAIFPLDCDNVATAAVLAMDR